jgi:hypothetical protein
MADPATCSSGQKLHSTIVLHFFFLSFDSGRAIALSFVFFIRNSRIASWFTTRFQPRSYDKTRARRNLFQKGAKKKSRSVQQKLGICFAAPCCQNNFSRMCEDLTKSLKSWGMPRHQSELKNQWIMQGRNASLCEKASTLRYRPDPKL